MQLLVFSGDAFCPQIVSKPVSLTQQKWNKKIHY